MERDLSEALQLHTFRFMKNVDIMASWGHYVEHTGLKDESKEMAAISLLNHSAFTCLVCLFVYLFPS